jgi:hypothetical protein
MVSSSSRRSGDRVTPPVVGLRSILDGATIYAEDSITTPLPHIRNARGDESHGEFERLRGIFAKDHGGLGKHHRTFD